MRASALKARTVPALGGDSVKDEYEAIGVESIFGGWRAVWRGPSGNIGSVDFLRVTGPWEARIRLGLFVDRKNAELAAQRESVARLKIRGL